MGPTPEQQARAGIDRLLSAAGWSVQDMAHANIHAARGVALCEFPLNTGFGTADYPLYIDGKAAGVIEAKKEGTTLTGVEIQSARYAKGLSACLTAGLAPPAAVPVRVHRDRNPFHQRARSPAARPQRLCLSSAFSHLSSSVASSSKSADAFR